MRVCPTCGARYEGEERFCPADGARLVEKADSSPPLHAPWSPQALVGTVLADRYRVADVLGEGGMGVVYLAVHEALQRQVAIKVLRRSLSREVGSTRRFLLEARAASQLDHENIISIFDFGRDEGGRYYIVMEYAAGEALSDVIQREGPFPQERAIPLLRQVLSALAAAHTEGIVHRDLKPENIICTERRGRGDFLKILDFGLAKILGDEVVGGPITHPGIVMGTPEFMSPEQARGDAVDGRSDIYSAGVLAYEMLTGRVPFEGTYVEVLWDQAETAPTPPSKVKAGLTIHQDLEILVLTMLEKRPEERFQNASAALAVLDRVERTLAEQALKSKSVVERTRAELRKSSVIAPPPRADRALARTVMIQPPSLDGPSPSQVQTLEGDSVWHRSNLLQEASRLSALRGVRLRELGDLVWGGGERPPEVLGQLAAIQRVETLLADKENEIALLRERLETNESTAREREAALRRQRVDLVARAATVTHALARADGAEVTADLPASTAGSREGGTPTLRVPDLPPEGLRAELADLEAAIRATDRSSAELAASQEREVGAYERAIQIKLDDIERLKTDLATAYDAMESVVRRVAAGRGEVADHLAALDELAEGIRLLTRALAVAAS